jgi:beta-glucanase (GH16 family)
LSWEVDGKVLRTLNRNDTYDSKGGQYHYPQTPSRVQFSLWPAGKAGNAQGTIEWAGGEIDWSSPYMQNGYYYAMIKDVTVDCYSPPPGYKNLGNSAYYYMNDYGTNDTVAIGNNNTILSSFQATGEDPKKGASSSVGATKTGTKSSASASATAEVESIPGVSGGGSRESGSDVSGDSGSSSSGNTGSSGSSGSGTNSFSQGLVTTGVNDGSRVVAGSLVALNAFLAAAMLV